MADPAYQSLTDVSAPRRRPAVIAHRGASREAPENTLPALRRAIEIGADGVEFDVLLTRDKVPILAHDDDLSRISHHRGYAHETPFATVRSLDVGSRFGPGFAGTTPPTLAEALELLGAHKLLTIVEIKPQPGLLGAAAQIVGGVIEDVAMRGPLLLSSASIRLLRECRARHPQIPRALILKRRSCAFFFTGLSLHLAGATAVHPSVRALKPGLVQGQHRHERAVRAWTANDTEEIDQCLSLEVDGIITDDPLFVRSRLEQMLGLARPGGSLA